MGEISRETMSFPQGSTCPIARWSKGQVSTEMMLFLDHFCQCYVLNKTQDPLLLSIVSPWLLASIHLCNIYFFCCFYKFGLGLLLFILLCADSSLCAMLRHMGRVLWTELWECFSARGIGCAVPKGSKLAIWCFHFWDIMPCVPTSQWGRRNEALPWPLNITWLHMMPMIFWINLPNLTRWRIPSFEQIKSKKIFFGRPSRLSRRVSTRSLPNSVMLRALTVYEESLKAAMRDLKRYGCLSKLIGTIGVFRPLQLTVLKATHTIIYVKSWLAVFVLGPVVVQSGASTQSGDARKRSREKSGSRSGHIWGGSGATLKKCGIMDRSS